MDSLGRCDIGCYLASCLRYARIRTFIQQSFSVCIVYDSQIENMPGTEAVENVASTFSSNQLDQQTVSMSMLKLHEYEGNILLKFAAPRKTLRLLRVCLVMFYYAGLIGGVVTITTVGPTLITSPPYLWGNNAGLIIRWCNWCLIRAFCNEIDR